MPISVSVAHQTSVSICVIKTKEGVNFFQPKELSLNTPALSASLINLKDDSLKAVNASHL